MATFTFDVFYLGSFADVDVDEGDTNAENADDLLAIYDDFSVASLLVNDADDDGTIRDNEIQVAGDTVSFDVGAGNVTTELDSSIEYAITVTRGDGSTYTTTAIVYQTVTGDVFVLGDIFDGINVQSFELTSAINTDPGGTSARDKLYTLNIVCFATGTIIETAAGPQRIEQIVAGTLIRTYFDQFQPVRHIGRNRDATGPTSWPVCFAAGSLGKGMPSHELRVTQNHRIMTNAPVARQLSGHHNAFLAAKHLAGLTGIALDESAEDITYWYMLFDRHQAIQANGAWAESLFLGRQAIGALSPADRVMVMRMKDTLDPGLFVAPRLPDLKGFARKELLRSVRKGQPVFRRENDAARHANQTRPATLAQTG